MSDHSEKSSNPSIKSLLSAKALAVAGATFSVTTMPLIADGRFTLMDMLADLCAVIGAVSALYLKRPEREDTTNG